MWATLVANIAGSALSGIQEARSKSYFWAYLPVLLGLLVVVVLGIALIRAVK